MTVFGVAYWPALAITAVVLAAAGVLLEFLAYRPLRNESHILSFISALGALFILENGVIALWGPQGQRIPNPYPGVIDAFGITMTQQRLLVIVVAVVMIVCCNSLSKRRPWEAPSKLWHRTRRVRSWWGST
jgi:branched-chain amino acid transport system permease protein